MTYIRHHFLSSLALLALGACSMFGGAEKAEKAKEEERAGRVNMSVLDQKLTANPEKASVTVQLSPPAPVQDWPQAGETAAKTPEHAQAGEAFKIDWRADVGAGSDIQRRLVAPPVVSGGRVFVIDANQRVSAYDAERGRRIWTKSLTSSFKRDKIAVGSGLAVAGDRLIVSSGYGYIVALSTADGQELWKRTTESPVSGSPAILGGRAYVTTTNNELYALNVETGDVSWTDQAIAESARILASPSPAVSDEILVAPYSSGELIAYIPANGRRLWTDTLTTVGRFTPLSAINDISGRPAIREGIVYAASHSGVLAAIDSRTGARLWNILFGSRLGPVINGEHLFIIGTGGQLACINRVDGSVVWVRDLKEYRNEKKKQDRIVWTGPLIASNRLVVVSSEGEMLGLSPQTGETDVSLKLGAGAYIEPVAAGGRIFVLTDKGQLIAVR
jgi:outer membrane protein assembly factor BamB